MFRDRDDRRVLQKSLDRDGVETFANFVGSSGDLDATLLGDRAEVEEVVEVQPVEEPRCRFEIYKRSVKEFVRISRG